jgi:hypothetical protein
VTGPPGSARACPVCGRHTLALERPPEIQVVGAQPYTELYRMGDLPMPVGVRCRACEAWWPTVEALEAGEPPSTEEPPTTDEVEPIEGLELVDDVPARPDAATSAGSQASVGSIVVLVGAFAAGAALLAAGLLQLAFIVVGCGVLIARWLRRRPGRAV